MKAIRPIPIPPEEQVIYYNHSPFHLRIALEGDLVVRIEFMDQSDPDALRKTSSHGYIDLISRYLKGVSNHLDLPHRLAVSPFSSAVYAVIASISRGETLTYGEIAARIGNPKACRAVGTALGKNPLPLIIPCHRVLGVDGKLTGFAGGGGLKRILLDMERKS